MKGNFKVRCVDLGMNRFYTVGKLYEFKDGFMINDKGVKFPYHKGMDNFEEWQDFSDSKWELVTDTKEITIRQKGRKVIAVMTEDGKYVKSAKAKCSPTDEFDFDIGAKLAFQRLMGEETAIREVKRPAKVGEWIRITSDENYGGIASGDIKQVKAIYGSAIGVEGKSKASGDGYWCFGERQYVVLENYQPEETTKTLADYTDKELINELSRRWEDKK